MTLTSLWCRRSLTVVCVDSSMPVAVVARRFVHCSLRCRKSLTACLRSAAVGGRRSPVYVGLRSRRCSPCGISRSTPRCGSTGPLSLRRPLTYISSSHADYSYYTFIIHSAMRPTFSLSTSKRLSNNTS